MIPENIINDILDRIDIVDVVKEFEPSLRKNGSRYECCCPIHGEKTPSFIVTPSRGMFKCFGCGEGGNAITFLMKTQSMNFPEAIKYLAKKVNVEVEENEETEDEMRKRLDRESLININQIATDFFVEQINAKTEDAVAAYKYAVGRWGKDFVESEGIGYAPDSWDTLKTFAKKKSLNESQLIKCGLLKQNEEKSKVYDFFRGRIMIPIRDRFCRVIGFTARSLKDGEAKYLNSKESPIFDKSTVLYGIHNAHKSALNTGKMYLVEGGPDAMKLHSLGIDNTVAALGTAWGEKHFNLLRRYKAQLCFIPDIDKVKEGDLYGTGIKAVIKAGEMAFKAGFQVSVKEIPQKGSDKVDADSYFKSKTIFNKVEEVEFLPWLAEKLTMEISNTADRVRVIRKLAKLLAAVDDSMIVDGYIDLIRQIVGGNKKDWKNAINEEINSSQAETTVQKSKIIDQDLYKKFGFFERDNCYFSLTTEGESKEWSNFSMTPLFHIKDAINPKRLYRLTNTLNQTVIVEMKQEEVTSLQKFKVKIEGLGNFIFKTTEADLTKLKSFLYANTETATEVKQLGWNKQKFYAFGNGIFNDGKWLECDEFGIVRLGDKGNFYIPASSSIYKDDKELFQFERRFVLTNYSSVSLREYSDKLIKAFGDNAKVGLAYFFAALFKDVVTGITKNFPILNIFGRKGSGKSELGHSLMSFFIIRNEPPNITTSTLPGLAEAVAQSSNALVHIDEYKNSIDIQKGEFLKSLYDGVGRTRMNMDRDKKRETTAVDCGVILTGQEMPTIDIALFSRLIYLTFSKTEFTIEEKRNFDELKDLRDRGCSHLVLQLLEHRQNFERNFRSAYNKALSEIIEEVGSAPVEDRILRNWVIVLAAFGAINKYLDVSFSYDEMLHLCVKGILKQNDECRSNNDLAQFWQGLDFLHQNGDVYIDADYRIKYVKEFFANGMKNKIQWMNPRPVLFMCTKRIIMLYRKNAKQIGDTIVSSESLLNYLKTSKEFMGQKNAVRFKNFVNQKEASSLEKDSQGNYQNIATSRVDQALCFDYQALKENYGINLEVETVNDDEPDPIDIDEKDESMPY